MAIEIHEEESGEVIDVYLSGILLREDYRTFVGELAKVVARHGKARLLVTIKGFYGWAAGVLREEIKCTPEWFWRIERVAVIGDPEWKPALRVFCTPFWRAQTRFFYQAPEAQAWVHEQGGAAA